MTTSSSVPPSSGVPPQQPELVAPQGNPGYPPQYHGMPPQPGVPPQAGAVPPSGYQPGYQPGPPPAPKRGIGKRLGSIGGGLLAVVLLIGLKVGIAGGVAGLLHVVDNKTSDAALASVGDCVHITDKGLTTVKVTTLSCGDATASYKVGARVGNASGSCPDGDYMKVTDTNLGNDYLLCLSLNATTGDCVHDETTKTPAKVACGPQATYKVGSVVAGATDRTVCGSDADDTDTMYYSKPSPVVMCLVPVDQ